MYSHQERRLKLDNTRFYSLSGQIPRRSAAKKVIIVSSQLDIDGETDDKERIYTQEP